MSNPYVGEIRMFGGNFAPAGWMLCQGQILAIAENETLFNLIGTTYGGNGTTTFALPNLSSRVPVHQGSGYVLGQMGGVESVTLTANQLPGHTHAPVASANAGSANTPANNFCANWTGAQFSDQTPFDTSLNAGAVALTGGSQPHDNMAPFLTINFIISLFGIFPSQS